MTRHEGTVLIIGASGYVGGALYHGLSRTYDVVGTSHRTVSPSLVPVDITNRSNVRRIVAGAQVVVNAAGLVDTAAAEASPDTASRLNTAAVALIGEETARAGARLVQLSTDNVFDGGRPRYVESDDVAPFSVYGHTKWAGEVAALQWSSSVVIRLPLMYGRSPWTDHFVRRFAGPPIAAPVDVVCAPLFLGDLVELLPRVWHYHGVVHLFGPDEVSRFELLRRAAAALNLTAEVVPVRERDLGGVIVRPKRLVLGSERHDLVGRSLDTGLQQLSEDLRDRTVRGRR